MKSQEFDYFCEIYTRLEKIQSVFYQNSSTAEAHFELGKLFEFVKNIYDETDFVDEE